MLPMQAQVPAWGAWGTKAREAESHRLGMMPGKTAWGAPAKVSTGFPSARAQVHSESRLCVQGILCEYASGCCVYSRNSQHACMGGGGGGVGVCRYGHVCVVVDVLRMLVSARMRMFDACACVYQQGVAAGAPPHKEVKKDAGTSSGKKAPITLLDLMTVIRRKDVKMPTPYTLKQDTEAETNNKPKPQRRCENLVRNPNAADGQSMVVLRRKEKEGGKKKTKISPLKKLILRDRYSPFSWCIPLPDTHIVKGAEVHAS